MLRPSLLFLFVGTLPCPAQDSALHCAGEMPDWLLDIAEEQAELDFRNTTEMQLMLTTQAEDRAWPRALTLIGRNDTAIVLLHDRACSFGGDDFPIEAQVLTQRGQVPILLTGCCRVPE